MSPIEFPWFYTGNYEATITVIAISLVLGAFTAEVVRGGIEAIPFGQVEAALATGLSPAQAFRHVIVPQLGPIILPGLASEVLNVMKSTALAMTIGLTDLTFRAQAIEAEYFKGFEAMTAATFAYLAISLVIFQIFRTLEFLTRRK